MSEWQNTKPASFQLSGAPILFPVQDQSVRGSNRIAPRRRPYRDGAKLDGTGTNEDSIDIEALFFNTIAEPGLGDIAGDPLWPTRIDALERLLKQSQGETGTLHLPWRRNIRCRAENWTRQARSDMRDGEVLQIKFCEDNEDSLADSAFASAASARSRSEALAAVLDAEAVGIFHPILEATFDAEGWEGVSLTQFADDLEAILAAPSNYLEDIGARARRMRRAARRIRDAVTTRTPGRDRGNDPIAARFMSRLLAIEELAAQAQAEAEASLPATRTVTYPQARDLGSIAAELSQSYRQLLSINGNIEDPGYVPAGTPVKVFA